MLREVTELGVAGVKKGLLLDTVALICERYEHIL